LEKLNPKAVIFDLGSTLIEYEFSSWNELGTRCVANTWKFLKEQGFDIPEEEIFVTRFNEIKETFRQHALDTLEEWTVPEVAIKVFEEYNIEYDDQLIDKFFLSYYKLIDEMLFAYDDTLVTLTKIREKYPVVGLVSNTIFPEETHIKELNRFNIIHLLDFKIFSSTFGFRKPHSDIFYHAVNLAGYAPAECVYIGDRYPEDIVGPKNIGMAAILKVKEGREYPKDMPLATRRINTLAELFEHLDI